MGHCLDIIWTLIWTLFGHWFGHYLDIIWTLIWTLFGHYLDIDLDIIWTLIRTLICPNAPKVNVQMDPNQHPNAPKVNVQMDPKQRPNAQKIMSKWTQSNVQMHESHCVNEGPLGGPIYL